MSGSGRFREEYEILLNGIVYYLVKIRKMCD